MRMWVLESGYGNIRTTVWDGGSRMWVLESSYGNYM